MRKIILVNRFSAITCCFFQTITTDVNDVMTEFGNHTSQRIMQTHFFSA
jgi:hypothetical protein